MANTPPDDEAARERRTPLKNDLAPEGMDSDSEGDELESGAAPGDAEEFEQLDEDDHVEPDGAGETPTTH